LPASIDGKGFFRLFKPSSVDGGRRSDRVGCHAGIQIGMNPHRRRRRSTRRARRHLAFGLRDRLQARQGVAECDEPVSSGKDAPRGLAAIQRPLRRPDRIGTRWSRDRRSGGRERFRPVRLDDTGQVVAAVEPHTLVFDRRSMSRRWNSPTVRNRGRHGQIGETAGNVTPTAFGRIYTGRGYSGSILAGGVVGGTRTATRAAFPAGAVTPPWFRLLWSRLPARWSGLCRG
jgi:hypothetical protein